MSTEASTDDINASIDLLNEQNKRWTQSTRRLILGIALVTTMMFIYNALLLIPRHSNTDETISTTTLVWCILTVVGVLVLATLCIRNYTRGLKRFSTLFEQGGKRALTVIRHGFLIAVAGIALQLLVFFIFPNTVPEEEMARFFIGNSLLIVACIVAAIGFLSLATSKGMTDDGRKGALHMAWVNAWQTGGALWLSYALQASNGTKLLCTLFNIVGAILFYRQWKRIVAPRSADTTSLLGRDNNAAPDATSATDKEQSSSEDNIKQ